MFNMAEIFFSVIFAIERKNILALLTDVAHNMTSLYQGVVIRFKKSSMSMLV